MKKTASEPLQIQECLKIGQIVMGAAVSLGEGIQSNYP